MNRKNSNSNSSEYNQLKLAVESNENHITALGEVIHTTEEHKSLMNSLPSEVKLNRKIWVSHPNFPDHILLLSGHQTFRQLSKEITLACTNKPSSFLAKNILDRYERCDISIYIYFLFSFSFFLFFFCVKKSFNSIESYHSMNFYHYLHHNHSNLLK